MSAAALSNGLNQVGGRGKVYKRRMLLACPTCHPEPQFVAEKPWTGINPQLGAKQFDTHREAFDWAKARGVMMNTSTFPVGYDECHEDQVWRARHGIVL